MEKIEYRVRPITRYVVTRYHEGDGGLTGGCESKGTYDNEQVAHEVAYALAKEEHERLGWPVGDERIQYPRQEGSVSESPEYQRQAAEIAARQA